MEIKIRQVLERQLKNRNESINSIANNCSIPVATLHGWLAGTKPSAKNLHLLKNLSDYLNVSLVELLFNVKDDGTKGSILFTSTFLDGKTQYKLTVEKMNRS
jgi:hypothetical protein